MSSASRAAGSALLPAMPRRHIWAPMLAAFAVEALILAAIALWLPRHPPRMAVSPQFGAIRLDLTRLPTPEPAPTAPPSSPAAAEDKAEAVTARPTPEPAKPTPEPAKPTPEPAKPAPEQPMLERTPAVTPSRLPPLAAPKRLLLPVPDLSLLPREESAAAGPPQPAPPKGNGQVTVTSEFIRQVNAALQRSSRGVNMVGGIKFIGRVDVAVLYRDGRTLSVRIVKSSGFPALDKAIADALAQTAWPPPPPGLEGRAIVLPIARFSW